MSEEPAAGRTGEAEEPNEPGDRPGNAGGDVAEGRAAGGEAAPAPRDEAGEDEGVDTGGRGDPGDAGEILVESDRAFTDLTRPARRHRTAAFFGMLGVAAAAFVTGLLLFDNLLMPRLIHGVSEVRVPDLSNLSLEEGEKLLTAVGLRLTRAGERFDTVVPRGFIVSQEPPADTPVRGRRRVAVVVSLGEEFSSVPEVFGESVRGARVLVERVGLRVAGVTRAPSEDVGEGLVVASDPPAETVLPRGAPVGLLVSSGTGPDYYVMPDLLGREINAAMRQLEALGFKISVPPGSPALGTIVMQLPAPGSRITPGDEIQLQATRRIIR